jgi:hypothetical protein
VNSELKLEELVVYYPGAQVIHRSSSFGGIHVPVGLFSQMPYRADLYVEVPLHGPADRWSDDTSSYVPDVRVWAFWRDGFRIRSFHRFPDLSICAYMRKEWIWGCHPLQDLLDWSTCWVAKTLHLHFFEHWPGRHHCSANVRFEHTSPDGFCGCGSARTYRGCHMWEDATRSPVSRLAEEHHAAGAYMREVHRRGLTPSPTWVPLSARQIDSMRAYAEGAAI